jgi:D-alanine--poly(phosphoribitol) ligase subunit 2
LRKDILALVYSAMEEIDPMTAEGVPLAKSPEARLLGSDSGVDSLTFVNLVVALEEQIQKKLGKSVVLVDEDNMAAEEHPFRTIGTLAEYVERVLTKT